MVRKMPLNCCNPGFELHGVEITLLQEPLVASQAGSKGRSTLQCLTLKPSAKEPEMEIVMEIPLSSHKP